MLTFIDLINEVKRRALRNQSGTEYDEEIKNVINTSLFRIAREGKWRALRRKTFFNTKSSYTSGSNYITVTNSSTTVTISATACDWWTDQIEIDRRISFGTDSWFYRIRNVNSNTQLTIDIPYRGTTSTRTTYEIYPQEEYNLPVQVDHRAFLWHEDYGFPIKMEFYTDQTFLNNIGLYFVRKYIPLYYRMWGENDVMQQVPTTTPLTISSSAVSDTGTNITLYGKVAGYPYYETIPLAGTTSTVSNLSFDSIERVSKDNITYGRVTVTSSRGNYTVAVIPAGDTTSMVKYTKVQLFPLPNRNFPINVYYYKDPYRLVNNGDVHELGQEFDEAIILLSVAKIKFQESQAEGDKWIAMFNDELRNLKRYNIDKIDWAMTLQKANTKGNIEYVHPYLRRGQAGAYY